MPLSTKPFVHVYESKTLKKKVEIKILVIILIYLILFEYVTWQHDIGHYKIGH